MKSSHQVAFAAHPFGIVGGRACQRSVEKRLSETPNIHHDSHLPRGGYFPQSRTNMPRDILIKSGELQFSLLGSNGRQILFP